ncbi:PleD family two-component system response regulator [Roseivivax sp. THAF197b]|uniref:response regulator n=1 Tax=Roseivivax sp. THAF197b TaxID=2588299 RepID=UPI0012684EDA|nr:response regulator [Roseivivax sp. THAF197b]QFS85168.1 Alkaline phosphatase synthesis transcriptional regulatory protein PhoP [Roseivivax sp. THAF197b]
MRILIVDDDRLFLELVSVNLEKKGLADLTFAVSAEDALKVIDKQIVPFDCVLLDIVMPDIDGIELCTNLRQRPEYRTTPIIMITASQSAKQMDCAFEAGATDFLRKPLDDIDLTGRIHAAMLLVEALRNEKKSRKALQAVFDRSSQYDLIDPNKRTCFPDAEGMLDYFQFENKILQLVEGSYQAALYRIDMTDVFRSLRRHPSQNLVAFLHMFSKELGNIRLKKSFWYSYIGSGRFICCVIGRLPVNATSLDEQIDEIIHKTYQTANYLSSDTSSITKTSLNEQRIVSRSTLLGLIRSEFQSARNSVLQGLPEVRMIEDNIFAQISEAMTINS